MPPHKTLFANARFQSLLGPLSSHTIGQSIDKFITLEDGENSLQKVFAWSSSQGETLEVAVLLHRENSTVVSCEMRITPIVSFPSGISSCDCNFNKFSHYALDFYNPTGSDEHISLRIDDQSDCSCDESVILNHIVG